ncbi:hypothetical protein MAM1_0187d07556 [Mucor ambiguus]|uniref:PIN domain-containing protein n=1 Tax=Mucor ambiguus TaxID=91626 RepID=A0A0C9LW78_9FUNG|nr:hypothetical protein MAM1_0187d07556 [Mucor ambiguus]
MQTSVPSELNKSSSNNSASVATNATTTAAPRRRRRRPRNRRKQKSDATVAPSVNAAAQHRPAPAQDGEETLQDKTLNLTDLSSEAHALEKQLAELQTQLKINYANMPSKEQGRIASAIAAEQIAATEEEIVYVRHSLKKTYRQMFSTDLMYATTHHIEDKLWRYIFYAGIEDVRGKLRKVKPEDVDKNIALQKALFHRIDAAFKFYRELNNTVRASYHIDTKVLGIDSVHQKATSDDERMGMLMQSNYICMGDLARYHAQQAMASKSVKKTMDYWALAKSCYLKAIDVYRKNGKPYCQLALVSMSSGNAMDVVWYYCMSLAVKHPSGVGRDNLKSFYSKIRFSSKPKDDSLTSMVSQFVECFLHMHRTVMFNQKDSDEFASTLTVAAQLGEALSTLILTAIEDQGQEEAALPNSLLSMLHIIRTTLTRSITILMISVWIAGERLRDKANYNVRSVILSSQIHIYTFAFQLLTGAYRSSRQALEQAKESLVPDMYCQLETMVEEALLPGLSIWCTFLYTNTTPIAQYCMTAANDVRNREPEKKALVKSIQSFLSLLISHPAFPDPVLNVLPPTYPMSEDLVLLGIMPLFSFHSHVDFFKETAYQVDDTKSSKARKQVRWGRVRDMIKKMADSNSFDFIQYNQTEQKYSVIDENAKRQQQGRFMKALATQRLMEQVSSLEKNVNRMALGKRTKSSNSNSGQDTADSPVKRDVYTCVIDATAFLDGLNKVKKWANQTLNVDRRSQGSILEVIVPLEVIDVLDDYKKGTSHLNMQARESIRFLDQKLLESSNKTEAPTSSFLRTQKVIEKLADWSEAKAYWIGEESRSNVVDHLISDGEEEEDQAMDSDVEIESDMESTSSSNDDLFKPRRRATDDDDVDTESESEQEADSAEGSSAPEDEDEADESTYEEEEEYEDDEDEDVPYTLEDVPKSYRPILSCLLYYHSKQQARQDDQPERLVLVTNDEDLAWWAELFGDPKTRKRLLIKTVNEWDQMVSKLDFEKVYEYSWNQNR